MDRRIPLDAFEVLEPIARGGMGVVLRGEHRSLRIPVAIKVLSHARSRQERAVAGFAREVRAMASLDHPAIVRILDHGVVPPEAARADPDHLTSGSPYLVMELAHGTLDHPLPAPAWSRIRSVLLTLLDALAHAHARGIVHRDLKPANVLRVRLGDGSSVLKLSDFGLAYVLAADPTDERGAAAGTPQMMAPEQSRGAIRDFGPWTDLYALGCIAHRITTGHPPFDHPDEDELARLHLTEPPPPLSPDVPVPPGFAQWVAQLLEKLPARRFQRASDAARALLALRFPGDAGEPAGTTTPTTTLRSTSAPPRADRSAEPGAPAAGTGASERSVSEPATSPTSAGGARSDEAAERTLEDPPPDLRALATIAPPPRDPDLPRSLELDVPRAADPVPDWRRPASEGDPLWVGAALSLWGLRPPPFVARELERERCWRALREVCTQGRARAIVLRGPSGFGKSRLAAWLCERAHEVGAATPLHAAHEPLPSPASGLDRMLAAHLRTIGLTRGAVLGRVRRALPREDAATCEAVTGLLVSPSRSPRTEERSAAAGSTGGAARIAIVQRVLVELARERPLVVWLDDVQWGGEAIALAHRTLDAQLESPSPSLFVLTAQEDALAERPVEWAQLASLAGHEDTIELEIGPLPPHAHQRLVERLLGAGGELASRLAERTAGHPLFLLQLVGDWVLRGILEPTPEGLRLRPGASAALPDDLHEVWGARLEHLLGGDGDPEPARAALEILALAGGRADAALLASACEAAALPYPARTIDRMLQGRLLVLRDESEGGDGITLELVHGLLRETLERSARESGRASAHHASIATALATRWRAREPGAAERLATHLGHAGRAEAALAPLRAAAREHQDRSEYALADALLDRHALLSRELGLGPEHPERLEALVARAEVMRRLGTLDAAVDLAERALELASGATREPIQARALYVLGFAEAERGDLARGIDRLEQSRAALERIGDVAEASRALRAIGYAWYRRRAFAEGRGAYLRALELARVAGDRLGVAAALGGAGVCDPEKRPGDPELLTRALAIFEENGNLYGTGSILNSLGEIARAEGRLAEAEALYVRALGSAQKAGASHLEGIVIGNLAVVRMRQGDHARAYEELQHGLRRAERLGQQQLAGTLHTLSLVGAADAGRWEEWDAHEREASRALASLEASEEDVAWAAERAAEIARARGEPARARAAFRLAAGHFRKVGREDDATRCDSA